MDKPHLKEIEDFFKDLQDRICHGLEELDGLGQFHQDLWTRPGGGGGRTRVIEGQKIEKVKINNKIYNCKYFPESYFHNIQFLQQILQSKQPKQKKKPIPQ